MTDFLDRLVARARGDAAVLAPPSRTVFETTGGDGWFPSPDAEQRGAAVDDGRRDAGPSRLARPVARVDERSRPPVGPVGERAPDQRVARAVRSDAPVQAGTTPAARAEPRPGPVAGTVDPEHGADRPMAEPRPPRAVPAPLVPSPAPPIPSPPGPAWGERPAHRARVEPREHRGGAARTAPAQEPAGGPAEIVPVPAADGPGSTVVQVRIGRVEVRAAGPAPAPVAAPPATAPAAPVGGPSLDSYLDRVRARRG